MKQDYKSYKIIYYDLTLLIKDFIEKENALVEFNTVYPEYDSKMEIQIPKESTKTYFIMSIQVWKK